MDQERIRKLRELYARVEARLKNIEYNAGGNLTIPCVNQLRYAGNHLLEYLVTDKESELYDAEGHCYRALFDAYEVEGLFYLNRFLKFQEDYGDEPITDCVSQYLEWCAVAESAQQFVRTHSQTTGRGAYYEAFDPHVDALHKIYKLLPHARIALNKKRRKSRRDIALAVAGTVATVAFGIFAVFAWIAPDLGKEMWAHISSAHVPQAKAAPSAQSRNTAIEQKSP